jgi:hypothetical protein
LPRLLRSKELIKNYSYGAFTLMLKNAENALVLTASKAQFMLDKHSKRYRIT